VTPGDYHGFMKAVGVKQLKARLSEYLRAVKAGEIILVTDRDEVVAELRPARGPPTDGCQPPSTWTRLPFWELTPPVCEMACQVAPTKPLRTLDALHLATYLLARRRIENLALLTADHRLSDAARGV